MTGSINGSLTKQKILDCAATMFAEKGFTETSTRDLAEAVGLNPASMYYHFPSKNAILEHMMDEYSEYNTDIFTERDITGILRENPTSDGILSCLQLAFPPERAEFFAKVLCVLLQEQLRNPIVRAYVAERIILRAEVNVKKIIIVLMELGVISRDTDPDYWMKVNSSLVYSFASRMMLGIGDNTPGFAGMGMAGMLKYTFDMLLEKCGLQPA